MEKPTAGRAGSAGSTCFPKLLKLILRGPRKPALQLCDSGYADNFVKMWGELSRSLRCFDNVIGCDLINEPFTPDDISPGYFDEMSGTYAETLNSLTAAPSRRSEFGIPSLLSSSSPPIGRVHVR